MTIDVDILYRCSEAHPTGQVTTVQKAIMDSIICKRQVLGCVQGSVDRDNSLQLIFSFALSASTTIIRIEFP